MTKQEYYDLLVCSAFDGTFPSIEEGYCKYRSSTGQRCAVGILIPDNVDIPEEVDIIRIWDKIRPFVPDGMSMQDIRVTQFCHDDCASYNFDKLNFIKELNSLDWVKNLNLIKGVEN